MRMKRFFLLVSGVYLFISFFFLRGILSSPGVLTGNDWGLPATFTQMQQIFHGAFYTWANEGNLFGAQRILLNDALFRLFLGLFSQFNLTGEWLTKGIALFLLTASGFTLYYLCRYLKCSQKASFLAGLFYITTPPFFNYLSMGWIYVLLCFTLLPMAIITFDRSLKERGLKYKILTAFIFSLALFQLQALFWFTLVFILYSIFYIAPWKKIKRCFKSLFSIALSVLLLSAYWLMPLFFSSTYRRFQAPISAYDFSRFGSCLNVLDMSRLWGSLFNSQFESALPNVLVIFTFLLPLFAYSALILRNKNRYILFFTTLSLIPLGIFLTRKIILFIPYSGIFRDYSRHFILSTLAYSVLLAFSLDALYDRFKNIKFLTRSKIVPSAIFISLFVGINILVSYPFWSNGLSKEAKLGSDVRLKTIQFSPEYQRTEEWLFKKEGDFKTLWLPAGGIIAFWDKPKTSGPYGATWDLFAAYARKPGQFLITDKLTGPTRNFAELIQANIYTDKSLYLADIISLVNVRYLIVRTNAYSPKKLHMRKICKRLENDAKFQKVLADDSVVVFENTKVFPHMYPSTTLTVVGGDLGTLVSTTETKYLDGKPVLLFTEQNEDKEKLFSRAKDFVFFNHKPSEEKILGYLKKANAPTYFFSKELSGEVDSWEERSLKGSFYIPSSGQYFLRAKISPQYVKAPDYGLKERMGRNLKGWSFISKNVKYFTSTRKNILTVNTYLNGDAKEKEFLCLKREIKPVDLEKYPNSEIYYCLTNPDIQRIEAILGIDLNNDGKVNTRVSEQLPAGSRKEFISYSFNLYKKVKDSLGRNLPFGASFHLVKVYLKISKIDNLDCSTSPNKGWYKASFKNFGLYGLSEDKCVKSRDYVFDERLGLAKKFPPESDQPLAEKRKKMRVILSRSFENLDLKKYPYINLIHQNEDLRNLSVSMTLHFDFDGDGKTDGKVIQERITPTNSSFDAFELAKSEFPGKKHYYLSKLIVRIFENPELEEREFSRMDKERNKQDANHRELQGRESVFLQHLQIYNENILPYGKAHLTSPVLKIDQRKLSLTKSGFWYTASPVYLKEGYHNLEALFPGIETKLDFIAIELRAESREQRAESRERGPEITFQKINPTKYRVKVKNAIEPFWLVFSESFHPQWRAYLEPRAESREQREEAIERSSYRAIAKEGGMEEIVADYPRLGVKEERHLQKFTPSDIRYLFRKADVKAHYLVNGYANAWYIDPSKVQSPKSKVKEMEIVLYFWPQSLFCLGLIISGATFIGCIGYLGYSGLRRKKVERRAKSTP